MNRGNLGWSLANMNDHDRLIAGSASGVGPSEKMWSDCPLLPIMLDPTKGFMFFEDFLKAEVGTDTTGEYYNGLLHTERTQGTISNDASVPGGIAILDAGATTADTGITGQLVGCQCEPKTGTTIWMEWRCKINVGGGQCFMGLIDDSSTAPVSSSDAIATDKDLIGFYRDAGTGDTDWTVGVCNGSSSEEEDDAVSGASESAYEKFGIVLRGIGAVSGSRAEFYHNGECVHVITDTTDLPLLVMCPTFQMDADGIDRPYKYWDWIRVAVHNTATFCRES